MEKNGDPSLAFCNEFFVLFGMHPLHQSDARESPICRFDGSPNATCMAIGLPDKSGYQGCIPKVQGVVDVFSVHEIELPEWSEESFLLGV